MSPTTTRALKLKRRPPLTTAAQRRIFTTRSSRPSWRGSRSRSLAMIQLLLRLLGSLRLLLALGFLLRLGRGRGGDWFLWRLLRLAALQPGRRGRDGQSLDPAVEAIVAAVERRLGDAAGLGHLRQLLADLGGRLDVAAVAAVLASTAAGRHQGDAVEVV